HSHRLGCARPFGSESRLPSPGAPTVGEKYRNCITKNNEAPLAVNDFNGGFGRWALARYVVWMLGENARATKVNRQGIRPPRPMLHQCKKVLVNQAPRLGRPEASCAPSILVVLKLVCTLGGDSRRCWTDHLLYRYLA